MYPIFFYLQTLHFLCQGLISALNAVDLVGLSDDADNPLLDYCVEQYWWEQDCHWDDWIQSFSLNLNYRHLHL
jgi:hypothetical protein